MARGRPKFIKSQKAIDYVRTFQEQCPQLKELFKGDLSLILGIYYATFRPDLDESLILDAMQGFIYSNDRQVKQKVVMHLGTSQQPRALIQVTQTTPSSMLYSIAEELEQWRSRAA